MANVRASLLTSTTAVVTPEHGVNIEKCVGIEKDGDLKILFIFDYDNTEKNIVWEYASLANRDAEYALLTDTSANFKLGLDSAFVTSAAATITDRTGAVTTSEAGLNFNKVVSVSKFDTVTYLGTGSKDIYKLVFIYEAIDGLKEITWNYAAAVDRDTTFTEVTAQAAALQYIP